MMVGRRGLKTECFVQPNDKYMKQFLNELLFQDNEVRAAFVKCCHRILYHTEKGPFRVWSAVANASQSWFVQAL